MGDEGTLTDGKGRTVNFKNTILFMTSNIGSKDILQAAKQGGGDESTLTPAIVQKALEEALRPELLNRMDEVVVFNPLSYENLGEIANNLVANAVKRANDDLNIRLQVSPNIPEMVTREALSSASLYGARPIRRAVQRFVEDAMAEAIVQGFVQEGDEVVLDLKGVNGDDKKVVKVTILFANESMEIPVDDDAGVGGSTDESVEEYRPTAICHHWMTNHHVENLMHFNRIIITIPPPPPPPPPREIFFFQKKKKKKKKK